MASLILVYVWVLVSEGDATNVAFPCMVLLSLVNQTTFLRGAYRLEIISAYNL